MISPPPPAWYEIASREIGVHETPGPAATGRILEYIKTTPLADGGQSDETPWCSSFVQWCLAQCKIRGTRSAAARSWTTWGAQRDARPGAIVVIHSHTGSDPHMTTSGYHVGFWESGNSTAINLLGGNQSNSVRISTFPLSRWDIIAVRWPLDSDGRIA